MPAAHPAQQFLLMRVHLDQLVDRSCDVLGLGASQREAAQNSGCVVQIVLLLRDGLAHGFAELVVVHLACCGPLPGRNVLVSSTCLVLRQLLEQRLELLMMLVLFLASLTSRSFADFISNMQKSKFTFPTPFKNSYLFMS